MRYLNSDLDLSRSLTARFVLVFTGLLFLSCGFLAAQAVPAVKLTPAVAAPAAAPVVAAPAEEKSDDADAAGEAAEGDGEDEGEGEATGEDAKKSLSLIHI